jgi:hypothetical protein
MRALFVATTIIAIWLGRETHLIRERDRLVQSIDFVRTFSPTPGRKVTRQLPWHWKYLGAKPIEYMAIHLPADKFSDANAARVRTVYPELEVHLVPGPFELGQAETFL